MRNYGGPHDGSFRSYTLSPHTQVSKNPMEESVPAEDEVESTSISKADGRKAVNKTKSAVRTEEEVLVTIPGAMVHLIDGERSQLLGAGDFSLVRLAQEGTQVVVFAKVGWELKWPLVQEESTVKLDPTHYFFSLKPQYDGLSPYSNTDESCEELESLNYGVTFPAEVSAVNASKLQDLDKYLEHYSSFTAPILVKGKDDVEELPGNEGTKVTGEVIPAAVVSSDEKILSEKTTAAFWTTMAPNVEEYNSGIAKGIARGGGHLIRGIFWCSESTTSYLEKGGLYMKSKLNPCKRPQEVNPRVLRNMKRVRKISGMTDKVARGVLGGVLYTTGLFSSAVVNSVPGKYFFKLLPGEVVLVSLDAFGRVFDAVEKAGTDVIVRSSSVTHEVVHHRYGESTAELTDEAMKTGANLASTAWTITKLRKALNPKSTTKISKTAILKSAAKATVVDLKGKRG